MVDCIGSGTWKRYPAPYYVVVGGVEHQRALHKFVAQRGASNWQWVPVTVNFARVPGYNDRIRVTSDGTEIGWLRPEMASVLVRVMEDLELDQFEEAGVIQIRRLPSGQPRYLCHVWPYEGPLYAYEGIEQHRVQDWHIPAQAC